MAVGFGLADPRTMIIKAISPRIISLVSLALIFLYGWPAYEAKNAGARRGMVIPVFIFSPTCDDPPGEGRRDSPKASSRDRAACEWEPSFSKA
jgi:hypothetical protein